MAPKTVTAPADNDHVVLFLGDGVAPLALPVFMVTERMFDQPEAGIMLHRLSPRSAPLEPSDGQAQAIDVSLTFDAALPYTG